MACRAAVVIGPPRQTSEPLLAVTDCAWDAMFASWEIGDSVELHQPLGRLGGGVGGWCSLFFITFAAQLLKGTDKHCWVYFCTCMRRVFMMPWSFSLHNTQFLVYMYSFRLTYSFYSQILYRLPHFWYSALFSFARTVFFWPLIYLWANCCIRIIVTVFFFNVKY